MIEVAAHSLCRHVAMLPEAASIILGGGFPRHESLTGRQATQTAIFSVQRQLEAVVIAERRVAVALCDRGTVDGAACWPDGADSFWAAMSTTRAEELSHYSAVIHLEVPLPAEGYVTDQIRTESPSRAVQIDRLIAAAWAEHSRRRSVPAGRNDAKARTALEAIREMLPACCRDGVTTHADGAH